MCVGVRGVGVRGVGVCGVCVCVCKVLTDFCDFVIFFFAIFKLSPMCQRTKCTRSLRRSDRPEPRPVVLNSVLGQYDESGRTRVLREG
jgi:hypothetical protein